MKVNELVLILSKQNPDAEVIISKDSEGNEFSPVDEINPVLYSPIGQGDVYSLEEKGIAGEGVINAVVLYPLDSYSRRNWQRTRQVRQSS